MAATILRPIYQKGCIFCRRTEEELGQKVFPCEGCNNIFYCCKDHQDQDKEIHSGICEVYKSQCQNRLLDYIDQKNEMLPVDIQRMNETRETSNQTKFVFFGFIPQHLLMCLNIKGEPKNCEHFNMTEKRWYNAEVNILCSSKECEKKLPSMIPFNHSVPFTFECRQHNINFQIHPKFCSAVCFFNELEKQNPKK